MTAPAQTPRELGLRGLAGDGCAACDNETFRIFACLWAQVQLLRFCGLLSRRRTTLLDWLTGSGSRGSVFLLSCFMCVVTPDESTLIALACASVSSMWGGFPDSADDGGIYELLVHANLLIALIWALATGHSACEALIMAGPAVRCLHLLVHVFSALARLNRDFHDVRCSSFSVVALGLLDTVVGDENTIGRLGFPVKLFARGCNALSDALVTRLLRASIIGFQVCSWVVPFFLWAGYPHLSLPFVWAMYAAPGAVSAFGVADLSCLAIVSLSFWLPPRHLLALRWMTITRFGRCCSAAFATGLLLHTLLPKSSRLLGARVQSMALVWLVAVTPLFGAASLRSTATLFMPAIPGNYSSAASSLAIPARNASCPALEPMFVEGLTGDAPVIISALAHLTVLVALFNGVSPYLGLKTRATWSMLSNLRIEAGTTNHFFIPASAQVFSYTQECVTVTATSVPALKRRHVCIGRYAEDGARVLRGFVSRTATETGLHDCLPVTTAVDDGSEEEHIIPYSLPFFELRRLITETMPFHQSFVVEYLHCGAPHRFEVLHGFTTKGSDPRLAKAPPFLLQKLLGFRSSPAEERRGLCCL